MQEPGNSGRGSPAGLRQSADHWEAVISISPYACCRDVCVPIPNLLAQPCSLSVLARLSPGDGNVPSQDVLPGITATGRIQELADAITTYGGKDQAQGAKQTEAGKLLEAIKANVPKLAKLRRQVQLATGQAWPWRTPGVATIRKAVFGGPPKRCALQFMKVCVD